MPYRCGWCGWMTVMGHMPGCKMDQPKMGWICSHCNKSNAPDVRQCNCEIGSHWFWSTDWQAMEHEAQSDLDEGRYTDFETIDDMINDRMEDE